MLVLVSPFRSDVHLAVAVGLVPFSDDPSNDTMDAEEAHDLSSSFASTASTEAVSCERGSR